VRDDVAVGLWSRMKDADARLSRRVGLRFDDPAKTPDENIRLAQRRRRFWRRPPIVVPEDDFLGLNEAASALGTRHPSLNLLIARGILQPCFLADAKEGVTKSSVAAEVEWRRTASRGQKLKRRLGGILHWI